MQDVAKHYDAVGQRYDRLYQKVFGTNKKAVVRWLSDLAIGRRAGPLVIADIGGGTGQTIEELRALQPPDRRYILVEPFAKMADVAMKRKGRPDLFLHETAEVFAANSAYTGKIDVLICQEVIHHVKHLQDFFLGCASLLKPQGCIAIITRPTEVEFPFGTHTKRHWKASYAVPPEAMPAMMEKAGLAVHVEHPAFPVEVDKATWLECVGKEPLFSTFSLLSPEEHQQDLNELQKLPNHLQFNDKMIFILGKKS